MLWIHPRAIARGITRERGRSRRHVLYCCTSHVLIVYVRVQFVYAVGPNPDPRRRRLRVCVQIVPDSTPVQDAFLVADDILRQVWKPGDSVCVRICGHFQHAGKVAYCTE